MNVLFQVIYSLCVEMDEQDMIKNKEKEQRQTIVTKTLEIDECR